MSAIEQQTEPQLTLGWRLRMAMEHAGLTAIDMARELEMGRDTVGRWVHDETVPKRIYLRAWAERTNVSYEWLVDEPAPKATRGTRGTAGRGQVTDNKKSPERGRRPSRRRADNHSYQRNCGPKNTFGNLSFHLDCTPVTQLDHSLWVAPATGRPEG